jgi:predicted O-methyltransferase YrrM
MGAIRYLNRMIKRPSLILNENFLLHPISSVSTSRQILNNNFDLIESVKKLTNESNVNIKNYFMSISKNTKLLNHLQKQFVKLDEYVNGQNFNSNFFKDNPAGRLGRESQPYAGYFLYMLVRALKPDIFVETGVSGGESSTFILQAMEDNKRGNLHSIDFPQAIVEKGLTTISPEGKSSGWLIPDYLKHRWHLTLGKSEEVLEPLLKKLDKIDIFFHDSLHTYEHMLFEYNICWDHIKDNGVLISDDIVVMNGKGHSPFVDFANLKHHDIVVNNVIGGIKK